MTALIILFGALTLLAGIVIIINPASIFGFLRDNLDKPVLHVLAVAVRLIIGILLVLQSNVSKFPLAIEIIGWLSLVAAFCLATIGRHNFKRLVSWALSFTNPLGRVAGIIGVAFGAFIVYAFV